MDYIIIISHYTYTFYNNFTEDKAVSSLFSFMFVTGNKVISVCSEIEIISTKMTVLCTEDFFSRFQSNASELLENHGQIIYLLLYKGLNYDHLYSCLTHYMTMIAI